MFRGVRRSCGAQSGRFQRSGAGRCGSVGTSPSRSIRDSACAAMFRGVRRSCGAQSRRFQRSAAGSAARWEPRPPGRYETAFARDVPGSATLPAELNQATIPAKRSRQLGSVGTSPSRSIRDSVCARRSRECDAPAELNRDASCEAQQAARLGGNLALPIDTRQRLRAMFRGVRRSRGAQSGRFQRSAAGSSARWEPRPPDRYETAFARDVPGSATLLRSSIKTIPTTRSRKRGSVGASAVARDCRFQLGCLNAGERG